MGRHQRRGVLDANSLGYHATVPTGWTIETLRQHLEALLAEKDRRDQQRFDAQTAAINAALLAAEKAVTKAETSIENRLVLLNELRSGVATREQLDTLSDRLCELAARVDRTEGRSGGLNAGWGYVVAAAGLIIAVVSIIVSTRGG